MWIKISKHKIFIASTLMLLATSVDSIHSANNAPSTTTSGNVINLGTEEIQGELRRPKVDWIDSQKRVKAWLPLIHEKQFVRLEAELLGVPAVNTTASVTKKGQSRE